MRNVLIATLAALPSLMPALAETPPLRPLPGGVSCAYPSAARSRSMAGPVLFTAQVQPDGKVGAVDIRQVPAKDLGFEDAVRACVSKWRFDAASAGEGLRPYVGKVHYHLAMADEASIRALLGSFASAWNANDAEALGALQGATQQAETAGLGSPSSPVGQFRQERAAANWNMALEPDLEQIQFLRPDLAVVRQPFRQEGRAADAQRGEPPSVLVATAIKRGDWWTLLGWYPIAGAPSGRQWLAPGIEVPRKLKHLDPVYPELGLQARVSALVILECEVDTQGKVTSVKILRGHPIFDEAAVKAVQKWEYAPALLEGTPTPIVRTVTIDFSLDEAHPRRIQHQGVSLDLPSGLVRVRDDLAFRLPVASSQPRP